MFDIWNPYDPSSARPEEQVHLAERLRIIQQTLHVALLGLRSVIDDPGRDIEQVHDALVPFHEYSQSVPVHPADIPEVEALCRLVLERGGTGQADIQRVLSRLVGNTAAPASLPFLLELLHFSRRGDAFGPERRQFALWALARLACLHDLPEAHRALLSGLEDRQAAVRLTAVKLLLDVYRETGREVPAALMARLEHLADSDPDPEFCREVKRYLDKL